MMIVRWTMINGSFCEVVVLVQACSRRKKFDFGCIPHSSRIDQREKSACKFSSMCWLSQHWISAVQINERVVKTGGTKPFSWSAHRFQKSPDISIDFTARNWRDASLLECHPWVGFVDTVTGIIGDTQLAGLKLGRHAGVDKRYQFGNGHR